MNRERRVLVVDDDPGVRALLAEVLSAEGYRVATAPDGAAGLAQALAAPPDLVLTDLLMPRLDGAALCRRLMAEPRTRGVPVLVITALPAADAAARLGECPPDGVIRKPYDLDAVLRAVAEALPAGVPRPPGPRRSGQEGPRPGQRDAVEVIALLAVLGALHLALWSTLGAGHAAPRQVWGVVFLGPVLAWLAGRAVWRRWRGKAGGREPAEEDS